MNTKLLIDSIVQQTTVLIAQLSTAAGVRAPLSHVADEVFVSLARAIEDQGVGRKVVADMFGLALRTYQRKVQRLTESATVHNKTLWEAVLESLTASGTMTKRDVLSAFSRDDERRVLAVLSDLVQSGLVYSSGRGEATLYRATTSAERETLGDTGDADALATAIWAIVFHEPGIRPSEVKPRLRVEEARVDAAIQSLVQRGRLTFQGAGADASLSPTSFVIEPGAESGWEAAVFDHFQALVGAVIRKLERGEGRSDRGDIVGGSTFHFSVHERHPLEHEVIGSLVRIRREMEELYNRVTTHNRTHPVPESERTRVTFYFGQNVREPSTGQNGDMDAQSDEVSNASEES